MSHSHHLKVKIPLIWKHLYAKVMITLKKWGVSLVSFGCALCSHFIAPLNYRTFHYWTSYTAVCELWQGLPDIHPRNCMQSPRWWLSFLFHSTRPMSTLWLKPIWWFYEPRLVSRACREQENHSTVLFWWHTNEYLPISIITLLWWQYHCIILPVPTLMIPND